MALALAIYQSERQERNRMATLREGDGGALRRVYWESVRVVDLDPGYGSLFRHWLRHQLGFKRISTVSIVNTGDEFFPENLNEFSYLRNVEITSVHGAPVIFDLSVLAKIGKLRGLSINGRVYDSAEWPSLHSLHWIWITEDSDDRFVGPDVSGMTVEQICNFAARTPSVRQIRGPMSIEYAERVMKRNSRCSFETDWPQLYSPVFDCPITKNQAQAILP